MPNSLRMKDFVTSLLRDKLPAGYFYHNLAHTLYVADQAVLIGREEGCSPAEIDLLETAALWHDTGHIISTSQHESESCLMAMNCLPEFGYTDEDIQLVCAMIMATKIPQTPASKLDCILADADLEYLGTDRAASMAAELFRELQYRDPSLTIKAWNDAQIAFLVRHHYFTRYCKEQRGPAKSEYLSRLLNGVE